VSILYYVLAWLHVLKSFHYEISKKFVDNILLTMDAKYMSVTMTQDIKMSTSIVIFGQFKLQTLCWGAMQ